MTALESLNESIKDARERVVKLLWLKDFIESYPEEFWANLPSPTYYDGRLDFDHLPHADVMKVVKAFKAGKWTKKPNDHSARVDYTTELNGVVIRCWAGEPPPNCKIVEEEYEVPATPARKAKRFKLECTNPTEVSA